MGYRRRRKHGRRGSKISKLKSSILRSLMKSSRRKGRRRGRKKGGSIALSNLRAGSIFGVNSGIRKSKKGSGLKAFDTALQRSVLY